MSYRLISKIFPAGIANIIVDFAGEEEHVYKNKIREIRSHIHRTIWMINTIYDGHITEICNQLNFEIHLNKKYDLINLFETRRNVLNSVRSPFSY